LQVRHGSKLVSDLIFDGDIASRNNLIPLFDLKVRITVPTLSDKFTVANMCHEPLLARLFNDSVSILMKRAACDLVELVLQNSREWSPDNHQLVLASLL
jgi:hypothetical protein